MTDFFKSINDTDEVRQGDIIRKLNAKTGAVEHLGVVITADCDIAKKKAGNRYTWLEIVPMVDYLDGPWAQEQLRKLGEKRSKAICEYLNGQLRKRELEVEALTPRSLAEWLGGKTPEQIFSGVTGQAPTPGVRQLRELQGYAKTLAAEEGQSSGRQLKAAWELFDVDERARQEALRSAFKDSTGGFPEFFLLPELPRHAGLGFVVLLRSMWNVMAADLYLSEQDARIDDRPDAFHRLGRLDDGVRFSITQKLAFLFSRIGMPTTFETACETAVDLAAEEFLKKNIKEA